MIKQPLRILALALVSGFATIAQAQTIETPANTALTITSDMNLNSGRSVQVDGANFIKLAPASAGNVFMGTRSGQANTTGTQNTLVGFETGLSSTTAGSNTFMGYQAGRNSQGGTNNVFIGYQTGFLNTSGIGNMFLGQLAGYGNGSGSYNAFIGNSSGQNSSGAVGNTFIGDGSGFGNTSGSNNVYLGRAAGFQGNGSGSNNVFVGFATGVSSSTAVVNNSAAIGFGAIVNQSNAIVLGGSGINVGIGTQNPSNTFHVAAAAVANTAGVRLPITISSAAQATNQTKFLTVNAAGDVILGSLNTGTREGVADAGVWQTSGDNIVNTNAGGVVIGSGLAKTPVGYKLYVAGGMLTEKVKVALRNKSDWSDYVFEKGYKLAPLSEVSAFIKANGHLPGVPSADEMVSEGLDVAKMNAKLLEKVEELTLYMLNQQKQIQKLQNDNRKIKQQLKSRR